MIGEQPYKPKHILRQLAKDTPNNTRLHEVLADKSVYKRSQSHKALMLTADYCHHAFNRSMKNLTVKKEPTQALMKATGETMK